MYASMYGLHAALEWTLTYDTLIAIRSRALDSSCLFAW